MTPSLAYVATQRPGILEKVKARAIVTREKNRADLLIVELPRERVYDLSTARHFLPRRRYVAQGRRKPAIPRLTIKSPSLLRIRLWNNCVGSVLVSANDFSRSERMHFLLWHWAGRRDDHVTFTIRLNLTFGAPIGVGFRLLGHSFHSVM
jgi:hypothetical protein